MNDIVIYVVYKKKDNMELGVEIIWETRLVVPVPYRNASNKSPQGVPAAYQPIFIRNVPLVWKLQATLS